MRRKPPAPCAKSFVFYYSGEAVLVHTVPETPGNLRKPLETPRKPCRKPSETTGNLRNLFGNPAEKIANQHQKMQQALQTELAQAPVIC